MHIAVFLQHYHTPDCPTAARPYALVERLAREHTVTVLTTRAWEDQRLTHQYPWAPPGADLVRFDVPYDNAMASTERLRSFFQYATRAVAYGLRLPRPDVIIGSSTPLTAAAAAGVVASIRGLPWIFEVRDLWPDFPIQMGALSSPRVRQFLYGLEHMLYQSAAHVVTASPDMTRHVQTTLPADSVTTITYGTDLSVHAQTSDRDAERTGRALGLPELPIILYAGSLGRANDIPTLLDTARRLQGQVPHCFVFAGEGYHRSRVERVACTLPNVRYVSAQPRLSMLRLFRQATLSIVSFIDRPVLAANGPSKLYDSLGAGTPVLVTSDGWTRTLVEAHNCGWFVPPSRPDRLAERLHALLRASHVVDEAGRRARHVAAAYFDRESDMDRFAQLVRDIEGT